MQYYLKTHTCTQGCFWFELPCSVSPGCFWTRSTLLLLLQKCEQTCARLPTCTALWSLCHRFGMPERSRMPAVDTLTAACPLPLPASRCQLSVGLGLVVDLVRCRCGRRCCSQSQIGEDSVEVDDVDARRFCRAGGVDNPKRMKKRAAVGWPTQLSHCNSERPEWRPL